MTTAMIEQPRTARIARTMRPVLHCAIALGLALFPLVILSRKMDGAAGVGRADGSTSTSDGAAPVLALERAAVRTDSLASLCFRAEPGEVLRFALQSRSTFAVDQIEDMLPEDAPVVRECPPFALDCKATLRVEVVSYESATGTYELCVALLEPRVGTSGKATDAMMPESAIAGIALPFRVRLRRDGVVLGYGFSTAMGARERAFVVDLFANSHSFPLVEGAAQWETTELVDHSGRARASLGLDRIDAVGFAVKRQKHEYLEAMNPNALGRPDVVESDAQATFARGWVETATIREVLAIDVGPRIAVSTELTLQREPPRGDPGVAGCSGDLWDWQGPSGGGGSLERAGIALDWRVRVPELLVTIRQIVAEDRLDDQAFFDSWEELARVISVDPECLGEIMPAIDGQTFERWMGSVIGAIGAAGGLGSPEATAALGTLLASRNSVDHRMAVYLAAFHLESTAHLITPQVLVAARTCESDGERGEAQLLLGWFARVLDPGAAESQAVTEVLRGAEAWAEASGNEEVYLQALGNAGLPELYPIAAKYAASPVASVRATACSELAKFGTSEATALILEVAGGDPDVSVRVAAIESVATHPMTADIVSGMIDVVFTAQDPAVRNAALVALESAADQPQVAELLAAYGGG